MRDHQFVGDGPHCEHWSKWDRPGAAGDRLTFGSQCGWTRETHPTKNSGPQPAAPVSGA